MPRTNGRTNHPGTRRAHTRKGKPVRAASIKSPKTQQRRRQVSRQVQQGKRPLLWGAGIMAGLGALEAILSGRFFTAGMLFGLAGIFLVGHVAYQHHKNRQASKPARQAQKRLTERQQYDADRQKLGEQSTRSVVKWRAAKEGVRRRWETIRHGQEYADRAAAERKAALRWPKRSVKPTATPALAEPVRVGLDPPVLISDGAPTARGAHLLSAEETRAYTAPATGSAPKPRSQFDELVHPNTEASRKFYALRESGYRGPIDQNGNKATTGPEADILRRMAQDRGEKVDW